MPVADGAETGGIRGSAIEIIETQGRTQPGVGRTHLADKKVNRGEQKRRGCALQLPDKTQGLDHR